MKRYILLTFGSTPLLLVITFTVAMLIAIQAGFIGIPLGLLIVSWFFKYCFIVLDAVVAGDDDLPVLSIEMVNPVDEQRPIALAALITLEVLLVNELRTHAGAAAGLAGAAVLTLTLPASIAVLGITRTAWRAVLPRALLHVIRALRNHYLLLNAATLACVGVLYVMYFYAQPLWSVLAVAQVSFLLIFALIGGAVFEHRLELGIDSRTRLERFAERDAREHRMERSRMLDRAYAKFRVNKPLEGWQELEAWMRLHAQVQKQLPEHRALLDATSQWDDPRPGDRLANDLIAALLAKRANGEAVDVVEKRFATNPAFQVADPAHCIRLAELAAAAGKRSLQRKLVPET
jgi:hypothetical protein